MYSFVRQHTIGMCSRLYFVNLRTLHIWEDLPVKTITRMVLMQYRACLTRRLCTKNVHSKHCNIVYVFRIYMLLYVLLLMYEWLIYIIIIHYRKGTCYPRSILKLGYTPFLCIPPITLLRVPFLKDTYEDTPPSGKRADLCYRIIPYDYHTDNYDIVYICVTIMTKVVCCTTYNHQDSLWYCVYGIMLDRKGLYHKN